MIEINKARISVECKSCRSIVDNLFKYYNRWTAAEKKFINKFTPQLDSITRVEEMEDFLDSVKLPSATVKYILYFIIEYALFGIDSFELTVDRAEDWSLRGAAVVLIGSKWRPLKGAKSYGDALYAFVVSLDDLYKLLGEKGVKSFKKDTYAFFKNSSTDNLRTLALNIVDYVFDYYESNEQSTSIFKNNDVFRNFIKEILKNCKIICEN